MISFVICANSRWQDYATPYVESIHRFEPRAECILVDNGSPLPYGESSAYLLVRLDPGQDYNYMQALNAGARQAAGEWLAFTNDDILCTGPFWDQVHALQPDVLYGLELRRKTEAWGVRLTYVYGWILLMHRSLWETVGPFDEYYLHAGFDDLDYSYRVQAYGGAVQSVDLPFVHLADRPGGYHRRGTVPGFEDAMARSKKHFMEKVYGQ